MNVLLVGSGNDQLVVCLKIHPDLWGSVKIARQTQSHVGSESTFFAGEVVHAWQGIFKILARRCDVSPSGAINSSRKISPGCYGICRDIPNSPFNLILHETFFRKDQTHGLNARGEFPGGNRGRPSLLCGTSRAIVSACVPRCGHPEFRRGQRGKPVDVLRLPEASRQSWT